MAQIDVEIGACRIGVRRNIDRARELFSSMGHSIGIIFCDMITAGLYVNVGDSLKAMTLFQKCLQFAWGKYTEAVSYCLEKLGNASLWVATDHMTLKWTATFLIHSLKLKRKLEIHKALQFLGDMYLADGDQETAISLFTVALEGFTKMDVHRSKAECILQLGDISERNGDLPKAVELWKTARSLFERSSQAKQLTHTEERLARAINQSEHHVEPLFHLTAPNAPATRPDAVDVEGELWEDDTNPALVPA
ncbi:hypothetical protein FB451DRAFT_1376861 [Mycena latifolia]|nr:hypothetical protein FB451DRAFT_1376861 [Mycena latifolia]